MKLKICLASKSISRFNLLKGASINFEVKASNIDEVYENECPEEYVKKLAMQKGYDLLGKTDAQLIVSADSVAIFESMIIEKPRDREDAINILLKLMGNTHEFITGLSILDVKSGRQVTRSCITSVTFSDIGLELIEKYVDHFLPFSFAGGYDNSVSSWFIEKIDGSISNLQGLPMTLLREIIQDFGYSFFDFI